MAPSVQCRKVWLTPTTRCRAVTLTRRQTSGNLQGYPKLVNRSQPLVGRSSPYCEDIWGTYCCLTSFFLIVDTCLSCEDIVRKSCAMVLWLTPTTRVPCSNAAKTRNLLKFAGVPQTTEPISAVRRPKFAILRGHVEEVLLLKKFFSDCRYMP